MNSRGRVQRGIDGPERREEGQVLVLFALLSFVFVGILALSLDVGFLLAERRAVQAAADSAALAAARAAMDGANRSALDAAATEYGQANAGGVADVTLDNPPASGNFAGNSDFYQVTVRKEVPKFFLGAIYPGEWAVEADATAMITMDGFGTGVLALNSHEGGIRTSGSSYFHVENGSIVSNYDINTSGSTRITADEWVVANDGFHTSGSTVIDGGKGENPNGPEVPDPLLEVLQPPILPNFPGQPTYSGNPSSASCRTFSPWSNPVTYQVTSSTWSGGGSGCVSVENIPGDGFLFQSGNYRFNNGAGLNVGGGNTGTITLGGGTWVFNGNSSGIRVGGSTPHFRMNAGTYMFLNGAGITIGGSAPNNQLGYGSTGVGSNLFYFSGGGGIDPGGSNQVTLYPGRYIFNGGPGIDFSGSSRLIFSPGHYEFWFTNGAGFRFSGSSRIEYNGSVWAKMYFYGNDSNIPSYCSVNRTQLCMSGSTSFNVPPGEYYFDRAAMINSGSTTIVGHDVFLYFKNGSYLYSSGSAAFAFTAPEHELYPGYYPGVFMYSDRGNTAAFQWNGSTSTLSKGVIYLPQSPLTMTGASHGKVIAGQMIVDRLNLSGSNHTTIEFVEHVSMETPVVTLVE